VADSVENLVTFKIREEDRNWADEEQSRIRRRSGEKPTQAELFAMLRETYEQAAKGSDGTRESPGENFQPVVPKATESKNVTELLSNPLVAPWVSRLTKILESGHAISVRAITTNLIAFEELACGRTNPITAKSAADADTIADNALAALREKTNRALQDPERPGNDGSGTGSRKRRNIR